MAIISINPFTKELNWSFDTISNSDIDNIINTANDAWFLRTKTSKNTKKSLFLKLADILEEEIEHHATL